MEAGEGLQCTLNDVLSIKKAGLSSRRLFLFTEAPYQ